MNSETTISNRGRGPEIEGTRITVYSIVDYLLEGWHPTRIAAFLRISSHEVAAAIQFIREHRAEVIAGYARILDRAEQGNSPELQARLDASHARFQELMARVHALEETDVEVRRQRIGDMIREHRENSWPGGADEGNNGRQ